jgi:outer membrane protein assembly factor BamA
MRIPFRALAAVLLLASAASLPARAQYSIAKIVFHNPGPYTTAELQAVAGLQPGQSLLHDSLVNAATHLLNTGLFSDAQIDLAGTGTVRNVVIDLKPIPLDKLLPASYENLVWFTPDELATGIHALVPLYRGVASDAGNLPDDIQSALHQMLAAKGITATLSHTIVEPTNRHPVRVVAFSIQQPTVTLGSVHLSMLGAPDATAALSPALQKAANIATRATFNEGLSGLTLADILLSPARNAGYIDATLDSIQRTAAASPSDAHIYAVTYTARIVTGDAYKLSTLTWNPTPAYSAADFTRDTKLHPGDSVNASALAVTEAAISTAYLSHGYMDIYILSHPTPDAAAHTVAYTLEPIPGDIYHLKTVTPTGLSPEALQEFNTAWQMKPGEPYNARYVAEFIHANTALPHLSTYSGGFQAAADPQTHLVDLTIAFTSNR